MRPHWWTASVSLAIASTVLAAAPACLAQVTKQQVTADQLKLFNDALAIVQNQYLDDTEPADLIHGAIRGLMGTLDPLSWFIDPESYRQLQAGTGSGYGGVGLELKLLDGWLTVLTTGEGGAAWRAGVRGGDRLLKLDGLGTATMSLPESRRRLQGPLGTQVAMTLQREGLADPLELVLTREPVQLPSVQGEEIEPGLGYIRIRRLEEHTARELAGVLGQLGAPGSLTGLVLDLRGNPGGLLSSAIEVAEQFLPDGVLVSITTGRVRRYNMRFISQAKRGFVAPRLVVLVDRGSAAGTEIIAAAIQDHGRGPIVGEKTSGTGTVQTIVPLADGSGLRLTTGRLLTPKGRAIHGQGITPDVAIDQPGQPLAVGPRSLPRSMADRLREDLTLQQAISLLKSGGRPAGR